MCILYYTGVHKVFHSKEQLSLIKPLELALLDISGKVEPAIPGSAMTIAFLEDLTAKSDVIPIKN